MRLNAVVVLGVLLASLSAHSEQLVFENMTTSPSAKQKEVVVVPSSSSAGSQRSEKGRSLKKKKESFEGLISTTATVPPDVPTPVEVSSSDINRLVCQSEIKDVVVSHEKGVSVKFLGNNAFLKFLVRKNDGKDVYSTTPTEVYVLCGQSVFNIIAVPKRIPARTIRLSGGVSDNIQANSSVYSGLPMEKKILNIIKSVYTDHIPEGFNINKQTKTFYTFRDVQLTLSQEILIEGENLKIKEYRAKLKGKGMVELKEKEFLIDELTKKPIAISIDKLILKTDDVARIIIVETVQRGIEMGGER